MAEQDDGHWLDIQVHRKVHAKLTTWGKRLGLTPEGYAKLLILQSMHPLLAAEVTASANVSRATDGSARPKVSDGPSETDLAAKMWQSQIDQYKDTPDLLPAPVSVHGNLRVYKADNFRWPESQTPPFDFAHVVNSTVVDVARQNDGTATP